MKTTRNALVVALTLMAGGLGLWMGADDTPTKIIDGIEVQRAAYEAVSMIGSGTMDDPFIPAIMADIETGTYATSWDDSKKVLVVWAVENKHDALKAKHKRLDE